MSDFFPLVLPGGVEPNATNADSITDEGKAWEVTTSRFYRSTVTDVPGLECPQTTLMPFGVDYNEWAL